ncbi:MAG: MMPL family transporter [Steroidobacteraceae bacterium]
MKNWRAGSVAAWLLLLAASGWIIAHARFTADLSAFLPARATAAQQALVDELREGVVSRLILIDIGGGDGPQRAQLSQQLAENLRASNAFSSVNNGRLSSSSADQKFVFDHRYLLSERVAPGQFTVEGLRAAISDSIESLATPTGFLQKDLLLADPTGETLQVLEQLTPDSGPRYSNGVWVSAEGNEALLVAQTRAAGGDTNGQELAVRTIETEFARLSATNLSKPTASALRLRLSGPGVFAVRARATIIHESIRLSIISSVLIATLLLVVYRSLPTLVLGLLPVISGALVGAAAVALGFGVIHGVTLGFGVTLIGESVDYSVYLLIQARRGASGSAASAWIADFWPTVRLGLLTSVCGFASLLPSAFPGLAQLGLYSMAGLIAAAAVTRYVLPSLLPEHWAARPLDRVGAAIARALAGLQRHRRLLWLLPVLAVAAVYAHRNVLWNRDLAALSPVSASDQEFDMRLRGSLGAPDVRDLIVISANDMESALQAAEAVGARLTTLVQAGELGGFESAAHYLPSLEMQRQRRAALPAGDVLRARLGTALVGLPLRATRLSAFIAAVEQAREAPLVDRLALTGTSLASGVDALLAQRGGRAVALLPLRAPGGGPHAYAIDTARVKSALGAAPAGVSITMLDLKQESDTLYASYQSEAIHLSLLGIGIIVVLLLVTLRSVSRVARIIAPLLLAVLVVCGALAASHQPLTILHLIGLLLIVAVGSNYALFFDQHFAPEAAAQRNTMLASVFVANVATVMGFGVLATSTVPVLAALGMTVAPGALAALLFSALMARPAGTQGTIV